MPLLANVAASKLALALSAGAIGASATGYAAVSAFADQGQVASASVVKVIDGDTIDVRVPNGLVRVRLLNIDAPEDTGTHHECLGAEEPHT